MSLPAVFTGAGLSHLPPAGLPLAKTFQLRLAEACYAAARTVAPDLVDDDVRDAVANGPCNLLARLESTSPGCGSGAVRCMTIAVPSEAHLLAAVHLALGGLHVTVNLDEGVEYAYELLTGRARLPEGAPACFGEALAGWRRCLPETLPDLHVVWTAADFASADFDARPLLVKLNGSMARDADGIVLPVAGAVEEADAQELGQHRTAALDALAGEAFVVVTGYSGADFVCYGELVRRLRRDQFLWMAPSVLPSVRTALAAIDPTQPLAGQPADALRRHLPLAPPPWASGEPGGAGFEERFEAWSEGIRPHAAAEALGWALMDIGREGDAIALLERLGACGAATARTGVRLAEALVIRGRDEDRRAATSMFLASALPAGEPALRSYALVRWAECVADRGRRLPTLILAAAVAGLAGRYSREPAAWTRSTSAVTGIVLGWLERRAPGAMGSTLRRAGVRWVAERCQSSVQRVLAATGHAPGGRRRALLRRQAAELSGLVALLGGQPSRRDDLERLEWLQHVYEHLGDSDGVAATLATQALVSLSAGRSAEAHRTLEDAMRLSPAPSGVTAMVSVLLDASAGTTPTDVLRPLSG